MDLNKMNKGKPINQKIKKNEITDSLSKTTSNYPGCENNIGKEGRKSGCIRQKRDNIEINSPTELAPFIDHTLLRPDATENQIRQLCEEAKQYGFCAVCVNPFWVKFCAEKLKNTKVKICTVVGFPLGMNESKTKAYETSMAIEKGAEEIDMVINIGALKNGDLKTVENDLRAVKNTCRSTIVTKAIIETCLLTDEEKAVASQLVKKVGYDFVKTSTGFSTTGANAHDVALIRRTVGPKMGIKAAGGIRTFEDALLMIRSGATRLGCSASVKIVGG